MADGDTWLVEQGAAGNDVTWMRRALRLALRSSGRTWPNPGVGCVLVRDGRLLGAGRHERCGGPHAEILALEACRAEGRDPRGATAFITLVPCTRHGRTPPCTQALIRAGVQRVVAALPDPVQDAAGAVLAAAGIRYETGLLADLAVRLHGGFISRVSTGRPRITAKWAMTLDGHLACADGSSAWISSPGALRANRRRRRLYDAILVGGGTARRDDPRLLGPDPQRSPLRVVLSGSGDLPMAGHLVQTAGRHPVLVVHDGRCPPERGRRLQDAGVGLLAVHDVADVAAVCQALGGVGLNEVLVEGGSSLH
ncbi:MAG: bifunctional diaminohydroxyphosphoribosylaminopyrimidine deaminase/5-amino-6-(5-phosphoribosylamino)uracil reductase RibD, partial [Planctomycetota bacterium]